MKKAVLFFAMFMVMAMSALGWEYNRTYNLNETSVDGFFGGTGTNASNARNFDFTGTGQAYFGGNNGGFFMFDFATNQTIDLRQTDPDNWVATSAVSDVAYYNGSVFFGTFAGGKFGRYVIADNVTYNYSDVDIGDWWGTTGYIAVEAVDNGDVYIASASAGKFGVYRYAENLTYNLSDTDEGDWLDGRIFSDIEYDGSDRIYIVANNGEFGYYSISQNITYDLSATDPGDWLSTATIRGIAIDSNGYVYIGGAVGTTPLKFGYYNPADNVTYDLTSSITWNGSSIIRDLEYNPFDNRVYITIPTSLAGTEKLGVYDLNTNTSYGITDTDVDNWLDNYNDLNFPYSLDVDNQGNIFIGSSTTPMRIGVYIYNATFEAGNETPPEPPANYTPTGKPTITPAGGNFTSVPQNLTIGNVTGAEAYVWYLDGSLAQNSSSLTYSFNPGLEGTYAIYAYGYNGSFIGLSSDTYDFTYDAPEPPAPAEDGWTPTGNFIYDFVFGYGDSDNGQSLANFLVTIVVLIGVGYMIYSNMTGGKGKTPWILRVFGK